MRPVVTLPLLVSTRFQVLLTPRTGVLFTFPSRYWFTIGRVGVFSLRRWSSQIHTRLLVPRVTRVPYPARYPSFRVRGCHALWPPFHRVVPLAVRFVPLPKELPLPPVRSHDPQWTTPAGLASIGFRLVPFRSPLLRESLLLSLPLGTEMVHFPRLASRRLCVHPQDHTGSRCGVPPFGHRRITGCVLLPVAYRSLPRPSSPIRA